MSDQSGIILSGLQSLHRQSGRSRPAFQELLRKSRWSRSDLSDDRLADWAIRLLVLYRTVWSTYTYRTRTRRPEWLDEMFNLDDRGEVYRILAGLPQDDLVDPHARCPASLLAWKPIEEALPDITRHGKADDLFTIILVCIEDVRKAMTEKRPPIEPDDLSYAARWETAKPFESTLRMLYGG